MAGLILSIILVADSPELKVIEFGPMNFVTNVDHLFKDAEWQKGSPDFQEVKAWLPKENSMITHIQECPFTQMKPMKYFGLVKITRMKYKKEVGLPLIQYLSGQSSLVPYER